MNKKERQQLILDYYPLVQQIAKRVIKRLPSYVDLDDLIHIGTLGLIEAIDRFSPTKTPSFQSYARMRIKEPFTINCVNMIGSLVRFAIVQSF